MKVKMILACELNNGIGKQNSLPWPRNAADMKMFKRLTCGNGNNAVVMGYNTWKSLPSDRRPLVDRMNIVLTKKLLVSDEPSLCFVKSFDEISVFLKNSVREYDELWIIGGKTVYETSINHFQVSEVHLSTFKQNYHCDVFCDIRQLLLASKLNYNSLIVYEDEERKVEVLKVKQRAIS